MPNPKRRHSKRRTSTRRAHDICAPGVAECPNCHEPKMPHRVCPHCGNIKGREVIEVAEE